MQVLSYEFCEICKIKFFTVPLRETAICIYSNIYYIYIYISCNRWQTYNSTFSTYFTITNIMIFGILLVSTLLESAHLYHGDIC